MIVFLAVSLLLVGAYGGNQPTVMGHSGGEIDVTTTASGTQNLNTFAQGLEDRVDILDNTGLKTFVGTTPSPYTGAGVGGYSGGNSKCAAEFGSSARMCISSDFVNGIPTDNGWYNNYLWAGDVTGNIINDCRGWTATGGGESGPVWLGNRPIVIQCTTSYKILCCN